MCLRVSHFRQQQSNDSNPYHIDWKVDKSLSTLLTGPHSAAPAEVRRTGAHASTSRYIRCTRARYTYTHPANHRNRCTVQRMATSSSMGPVCMHYRQHHPRYRTIANANSNKLPSPSPTSPSNDKHGDDSTADFVLFWRLHFGQTKVPEHLSRQSAVGGIARHSLCMESARATSAPVLDPVHPLGHLHQRAGAHA